MHSKTPNVFKLGALFGLLAVTQAFPALPPKSPGGADPAPAPPGGLCARGSSFGREYDVVDSRGHLHRRCFNDPPPRPQDVELQPPRERQRKKKTKGKSPVPKTKTKTPEQRGAEYIQGFRTQFAPDAPFTQKDWTKYSEQINKNFVEGFDSKTGVFQAATKAGTPGSNKLPVFRGEVRPGSVEVPAMYRSGPESISMYGEVPMKDRPYVIPSYKVDIYFSTLVSRTMIYTDFAPATVGLYQITSTELTHSGVAIAP